MKEIIKQWYLNTTNKEAGQLTPQDKVILDVLYEYEKQRRELLSMN